LSPSRRPLPRKSRAEAREQAINQIIDIATQEFVDKGLAGARIDEIAGRSTKRKIYYYFEGKEDLYRARAPLLMRCDG
jgi:AcrR family transcriptional regulator